MEFKVENRDITEAYTTIKKASRELKPELLLKAIEDLVYNTFGDEHYVSLKKVKEYNGEDDTCFHSKKIGCDINVYRSDDDGEDCVPYNISIDSVRISNDDNNLAYLISIGGIYQTLPGSAWALASTHEHGIRSMILYVMFCLNKFFNHK
jgi:hypothetical protein|nr:MAG TPA: hypothetical protein [Caudoviricetes sp.]